ncbi:tetratricopeptide repeat protein [Patescibacteria group bacterium]|nr:tetratricopeptide repeat protein [Patescibacteria group bacterium]MCL5409745.1 tetratricopeptide repeat protein [Patescibacteria group bacterium]
MIHRHWQYPLYNLAKAEETLGNHQQAVKFYQEALANMLHNPPASFNRPVIVTDIKIHLSFAEYQVGDKSALVRLSQHIAELEANQTEDKYNKDVWVSGGYMKLAELLKDIDQASLRKSRSHYNQQSRFKIMSATIKQTTGNVTVTLIYQKSKQFCQELFSLFVCYEDSCASYVFGPYGPL